MFKLKTGNKIVAPSMVDEVMKVIFTTASVLALNALMALAQQDAMGQFKYSEVLTPHLPIINPFHRISQ